MRRAFSIFFVFLVSVVILVGCMKNQGVSLGNRPIELSTNTDTPAPSPTKIEKTQDQASDEIGTATLIPTETAVPIPTIKSVDPGITAAQLLADNNGCEYPCFWGIVPGVTPWIKAVELLSPIADYIRYTDDINLFEADGGQYSGHFPVPTTIDNDGVETIAFNVSNEGTVQSIAMSINYSDLGWRMDEFLTSFGTPTEIYIWAYGPDHILPGDEFNIVFYYQERGMLISYFGHAAMLENEIRLCPMQETEDFVYFKVWNPEMGFEFEQIEYYGLLGDGYLEFLPLEEVSDLSPDGFFQLFTGASSSTSCFDVVFP